MQDECSLALRLEDELLKKFRYVCAYDGRSINQQVNRMIRESVAAYEAERGLIISKGSAADDEER